MIMKNQMSGNEPFVFDSTELGFTMLDYWRFHYSNIYDLQGCEGKEHTRRTAGVVRE